ncbi:MAG TPA: TonB-dependent receptor, partial [Steroidobacteraceae bacterium]|nr:TonB-dependent receptor [Steroidobacteraceae bacterium]
RGIESVTDLSAAAPNLYARSNPGANGIYTIGIRGSVSGQPAIWVDPPVGVYLDGVYLGKNQGSVMDVVDVQRVEVLRGPQGTLFGRNTEGGAINFVSRQPSGQFRGSAEVDLGNYGDRIGRLSVDLPKLWIMSVSFAARGEKSDGWATNTTGPQTLGALDKQAYRASVKFDLLDNLTLSYAYDYSKADNTPTVTSLLALSGWKGTFPSVFGPYLGGLIQNAMKPYIETSRPDSVSTPPGLDLWEDSRNQANTAVLNWQATSTEDLKYIFSTRRMHYSDQQSINGTPLISISAPYVPPSNTWGMSAVYNRITDYSQTSHELQWLGNHDKLHYVVGLYYFKDDGETFDPQNFSMFGQLPLEVNYAAKTSAKAAYTQADWEFVNDWTVTAGIRYTKETRDGFTHQWLTQGYKGAFWTDNSATCTAYRQSCLPYTPYSADFTGTTPMGALSYKYSDNLNFFARVARGFKSGGFSSELINPAVTTPYQPEFSMSYELGAKSTLLDGRANLNATLFYTKLTDQQTTILVAGTTQSILQNAGEGTRRGFELEGRWRVVDGWTVYLNYGYLDAYFDKYMDNKLNPPNQGSQIDTASNRLPGYAPKDTLGMGFDGRLMHSDEGDLRLIVDYSYMSKNYLYACNKSLTAPNAGGSFLCSMDSVPSTYLMNARLLFADMPIGPGKLDLSLFVKNLTNSDRAVQGIDFSMFRTANWQDPRMWMITAAYKW